MSDKIFVGSGKKKEFDNGGHIINLSICVDDLVYQSNNYGFVSEKNGKRYIKLKVGSKQNVDQWGNSHYVEVDTWKPDNQQGGNFQSAPQPQNDPNVNNEQGGQYDFNDSIPF